MEESFSQKNFSLKKYMANFDAFLNEHFSRDKN